MSNSVRPHRRQPTRLPRPWDSPGKNTGVGCRFLLQCMKLKSESEVAQSCPTLSDPMDCSLPGSSTHGIFQARSTGVGCHCLLRSCSELLPKSPVFLPVCSLHSLAHRGLQRGLWRGAVASGSLCSGLEESKEKHICPGATAWGLCLRVGLNVLGGMGILFLVNPSHAFYHV